MLGSLFRPGWVILGWFAFRENVSSMGQIKMYSRRSNSPGAASAGSAASVTGRRSPFREGASPQSYGRDGGRTVDPASPVGISSAAVAASAADARAAPAGKTKGGFARKTADHELTSKLFPSEDVTVQLYEKQQLLPMLYYTALKAAHLAGFHDEKTDKISMECLLNLANGRDTKVMMDTDAEKTLMNTIGADFSTVQATFARLLEEDKAQAMAHIKKNRGSLYAKGLTVHATSGKGDSKKADGNIHLGGQVFKTGAEAFGAVLANDFKKASSIKKALDGVVLTPEFLAAVQGPIYFKPAFKTVTSKGVKSKVSDPVADARNAKFAAYLDNIRNSSGPVPPQAAIALYAATHAPLPIGVPLPSEDPSNREATKEEGTTITARVHHLLGFRMQNVNPKPKGKPIMRSLQVSAPDAKLGPVAAGEWFYWNSTRV